jgi:hypothetical protein
LYAHKIKTSFWGNVTVPEEFGFASTSPFYLPFLDKFLVSTVSSVFEGTHR